MRRLFLVACYDSCLDTDGGAKLFAQGPLMHYLKRLSECGDVAVCFDNELTCNEIDLLDGFCKKVIAHRHNEYDFGSYKRLFAWAREQTVLTNHGTSELCTGVSEQEDMLSSYDRVYLVNDSVYCLTMDLKPVLETIEAFEKDAIGMVLNPHHGDPYIESWFVGLTPKIFKSNWFAEFITSVSALETKVEVCHKYEIGLSRLILENGCSVGALLKVSGRGVYNSPLKLYRKGLPFVKRNSFVRHNGSLGYQLNKLLCQVNPEISAAIKADLDTHLGKGYSAKLLNSSYLTSRTRHLKYLLTKL